MKPGTGIVTNPETSKRLAVVWPFTKSPTRHRHWLLMPGEDEFLADGVVTQYPDGHWYDRNHWLAYPARDLSELEVKIREMGFEWRGRGEGEKVHIWLYDLTAAETLSAVARSAATHIIDAFGAAVAETLEAAGEGGRNHVSG